MLQLRRCLLTMVLIAALGSTATPTAAAAAPSVGSDGRGVTAQVRGHAVVLRFGVLASRRYAKIAGRRVHLRCVTMVAPGQTHEFGIELKASRRRAAFRIPGARRPVDYCEVELIRPHATDVQIAVVALSPHGSTYIDERSTAAAIIDLYALAAELGHGSAPSAASVVAAAPTATVGLDGPGESPPQGKLGYWSDGMAHLYVAKRTSAGRVLFFEAHLDTQVVTTNILAFITGTPR